MSASEMLARIVEARILDEKTLERLRRQVEDPAKAIKPKAIVKFLQERGLIDDAQAEDLLAGRPLVAKLVADPQFEEPVVMLGKEHDTDDLTNLVGNLSRPAAAAPPAASPKPAAEDPLPPAKSAPREEAAPARPAAKETRMMDAEEVQELSRSRRSPERNRPAREPAREQEDEFSSAFSEKGASVGSSGEKKAYKGKKDTSDQWNTRWLWTGFGFLGLLVIAAGVLWLGVLRVDADKLLGDAATSYSNEAYGDAAAKYDQFVKNFPKHDKASFARVRSVNAKLRFPYNSGDFSTAYGVALEWLPKVAEEPALNDELRPDLALMLPKIAEWYSEQPLLAKEVPVIKEKLDKAREVYDALIASPNYLTNSQKGSPNNIMVISATENNLLMAEGILKKEDDYKLGVEKIKELTTAGETDKAFSEFTRLVRTYPDLGARTELRDTMAAVSKREVELVKSAEPDVDVIKGALPSAVVRQILTGSTVGSPIEAMRGEILPVLAEGAVWGVDAGTGKLVWRIPVGLETTLQPRWLNEDDRQTLLVSDQQRNLLMRVQGDTGVVEWTARIGQPFLSPRSSADAIFVTTRSGLVIKLAADTGNRIAAVQLPRRVSVTCELADQSPELFVLGDDSNLYILSSESLACSSVFYLGHFPGTVEIAPQYWSGHLLVPVNGSDFSDLVVLRPAEEAGQWKRLQQFRLANGRVTSEPTRLGRMMLFTSINGDIRILDINPAEPENPIRITSEEKFDVREGIRTWATAAGSDMWIAGRGIMSYRIQRATGLLERNKVANGGEIYLGPLVKRDDVMFELRRRDSSGLVSVSAINAATLEKIWRTDFAGTAPGTPFRTASGWGWINPLGNLMRLSEAGIAGGTIEEVSKASDIDEVFAFQQQIQFADGSVACLGPAGFTSLLSVNAAGDAATIRSLQSPAEKRAAPAIAMGTDLVIPTIDGQLTRVDPVTGRFAGSPFLPPLSPGQQVAWNAPALVSATGFVVGNGQNGLLLMDGTDRKSLVKADEVAVDGQLRSAVLAIGDAAYVVEETANEIRLLKFGTSTGKLARQENTHVLQGLPVQDPIVVGDRIVVLGGDGRLTVLDADLKTLWSSANAGTDRIAAAMDGDNGALLICRENGVIQSAQPGGELEVRWELGQPVVHAPVAAGNQWIFSAADGTLLLVEGAGN